MCCWPRNLAEQVTKKYYDLYTWVCLGGEIPETEREMGFLVMEGLAQILGSNNSNAGKCCVVQCSTM